MSSTNHHSHEKPTRLTWFFWHTAAVLALSSLLSPAQAEEDSLAGLFSGDPTETKRLIVVLKMPDIESEAESGTRSKRAATRARKDAVKSVQDQFLSKLTCPGEISCPMSGATVTTKFKYTPAVVAEVNEAAAKAMGKMDMVAFVEADVPVPHSLYDSTRLIGADTVWAQGYSGAGQAVAVLDTGVDKTHPALAGKVVAEACYSTISAAYNATTVCPNGLDEQEGDGAGVDCDSSVHGCSHGTHVAGIVAANGSVQGVARDADIIAIQVFSRFDSPTLCSSSGGPPCALSFTSAQIDGLERVLELHNSGMTIAAINMSLGGGNYPDVCSGAIQSIIDQLRAAGIPTIVASGNNGYKNGIASPACISSAISVGATDKSDNVASYSNSADILDLLAPGSSISSTMPGGVTGTKSGTSMAAPHVAGAWAVLKQAAPTADVDDILRILERTGKPIEDWRTGIPNPPRITPRINLVKALKRLAPADTAPDIQVAPTSHDFGDVTIGESSSMTVTIENTGDDDLKLGQLNLAGTDFAKSNDNCANTTVAAGDTCTIKVTFVPQTEGAKNATLSIPSNDPDTATATVTLTGNGIAAVVLVPDISVTPTSHDFGDVEVGDSLSVTVTIENTGDENLELGQLNLAGTDFAKSNDNCANTTVAAGDTCTIKVTFVPQTEGAKNATLSIPSNDPDTATATVTLTGNGIAAVVLVPDISVTPTSHDFGDVEVGDSLSVTVTIENTGDENLELGQLNLAGTDFAKSNDNCANTTVAAGDTCTIKVTFVPQTEGAKNATLSIPSNDPDTATATVTLTGNGIAAVVLVPDISVTPTSHDFGDVEVGDSLSVTVTIENTGDENLELGQLNLAGTDFAKSNDNCANTTVAAGDTCTIKVTFVPQTEGAKNATLSIPSNDPDTATATVTLTGNGVANDVVTPTPAPAPCQLYAVNDQGLNNSQFFTISLDGAFSTSKLGPLYKGCDIEAFAICPKNNKIYAASGDNVANNPDSVCSDHQGNGRKGHLYRVDGKTGELVSIGDTGFNEIEDLAFSADCKTLWAWAKGDGLITIDTTTGKGTLDTPAPKMPIEGLAYNNDNTVLYGAAQTDLWKYDPVAKTLKLACTNLPGETEALEMMPDGNLLLGTHRDKTLSLHLFNPNTCQVIIGADIPTSQFDDVEGIAWPIKACTK